MPERIDDLERIYSAHHGLVYRAAYRVTGNPSDAEDVLQTVFLRLVRREPGIEVENLESYLYRAAVNAAVDVVRKRRDSKSVDLEEAGRTLSGNPDEIPDRQHSTAEVKNWVRAAVARLHPTASSMFTLRYFEGHDNAEVARLMGTSASVVAVTLHRARTRLQEEFRAVFGETV